MAYLSHIGGSPAGKSERRMVPGRAPGFVIAALVLASALVAPHSARAGLADEMMISLWCSPPVSESTDARYAEVAKAGFTVVMPPCNETPNKSQNKKILDLCQKYGMKAIIKDRRVRNATLTDPEMYIKLDAAIADYSSHPALYGFFVADEPTVDEYADIAAVNQYLLANDPDHIPFINQWSAQWQQGNLPAYEQKIETYLNQVRPKLLSYDCYALFDGGTEGSYYFENLEIIRRCAQRRNLQFNNIFQCVKHDYYRNPSMSDLRWQIMTTLAYGGRGVTYFTYWTILGDRPLGPSGEAVIGRDGKPTEHYQQIYSLNREVKMLARTLVKLRSTAVYHTGKIPTQGQALPDGHLISGITGGKAVIGMFSSDDGKAYVMLVSKDLDSDRTLQVSFSQPVTLSEVSHMTGLQRTVGTGQSFTLPFRTGDGRLFEIVTAP